MRSTNSGRRGRRRPAGSWQMPPAQRSARFGTSPAGQGRCFQIASGTARSPDAVGSGGRESVQQSDGGAESATQNIRARDSMSDRAQRQSEGVRKPAQQVHQDAGNCQSVATAQRGENCALSQQFTDNAPAPAPTARRTAISRRRVMARPSRRFDTLAHASKRMRLDAMPKPASDVPMSLR